MTIAELELEAAKLGVVDIHVSKPGGSPDWVCVLLGEGSNQPLGVAFSESIEGAVTRAIEKHRASEARRLNNG